MQHAKLTLLLLLSCALASCSVDKRYVFEGEDPLSQIDLNVTLFQSGRQIPIGSTEELTLERLVEDSGYEGDFLSIGPDGNYATNYEERLDLSKWFKSLDLPLYEGELPEETVLPERTETFDFHVEGLLLDDVPPMFRGDDVCLDPRGCKLTLQFEGNIFFDSTVEVDFTAWRNGSAVSMVGVKNIKLPLGAATTAEYSGEDLDRMFKYIPDSLEIYVRGDISFNPGKPIALPEGGLDLKLNYRLDIPFTVGPEFNLPVSTDLDLGSGLSDIFKYGPVGIRGTFSNALSLGADLDFGFVGRSGSLIELSEDPLSVHLAPNMPSEVEMVIRPGNSSSLDEVSALRLNILLRASSKGAALSPKDYVRAEGISLYIPEGITLDLNSL